MSLIAPYLDRLFARADLTEDEAETLMHAIMRGEVSEVELAALLAALRTKGETVDEITGFARAMRANATRIPLPDSVAGRPIVDTCGTGGDGSGTFNISTAAAFVVAAAGVPVAKHGNRAASSKCGSADVLQALGVNVDLDPAAVGQCVGDVGIGFLFAPQLHAAMKYVVPVRKVLKVRTVFNLLGPLTNPAGATHQVLGVFDKRWCQPLACVLLRLGGTRVIVVHGNDGLDEITTTTTSQIAHGAADNGNANANGSGSVETETFDPATALGLRPVSVEALRGDDATTNAAIIARVFDNEQSAARDIVCVNAGAALYVAGTAGSIRDGFDLARETIASGRARATLAALVTTSQKLGSS